MEKIRIGGVPEHFNLPWHIAIEEGSFKKRGIDIEWSMQGGGTGAMCAALADGTLDLAVVLTEGITHAIAKGNPSKIIQMYVKSPLVWGVHCHHTSPIMRLSDCKDKIFAISRFGSGSHIMAYVLGQSMAWQANGKMDFRFLEVGNYQGAKEAMKSGEADILLWEKFTTKPDVDAGELRRVGQTLTPWPCFVIAGNAQFLKQREQTANSALEVINQHSFAFMNDPYSLELVMSRHHLSKQDAYTWFHQTEWANHQYISKRMLENVINTLKGLGLIDGNLDPSHLMSPMSKLA